MDKDTIPTNDTKERILRTAMLLFNARSYGDTSVQNIIEAAGVSKGSFYYYFEDKESLFFQIHEASLRDFISVISRVADEKGIDPAEKVRRLVKEFISYLNSGEELSNYGTYVKEIDYLTKEHQRISLKLRKQFFQRVRDVIYEGKKTGCFRQELDESMVAFAIIGMCMWTANWFNPDGEKTCAEIAESFSSLILSGLLS